MEALQLLLDLHEARNHIERTWGILSRGQPRFYTAMILGLLRRQPDIQPREVRRRTGIHQTQLERLQRVLVEGGYVRRNHISKRHKTYALTSKGVAQIQAFEQRAEEMFRAFFGNLEPGEITAIEKGLARLRERSP